MRLLHLFICLPLQAATVTLSWDANTEPDIAGYRLYCGLSSRSYTQCIETTNTTGVVSNVTGQTYFAVTAYNASGLESDFSNEVVAHVIAVEVQTSPDLANWSTLNTFYHAMELTNEQEFFRAKIGIR